MVRRIRAPEPRDWQWALIVLIALFALALAYFSGAYWGAPASLRASARQGQLARALKARSGENAKLRARVAFLTQSLALSKQSEADTKKLLFKQQAGEVALKKKLALYQGMFAQGTSSGPVDIAGLQIIPTANAHVYRFQIVLVRAKSGKHSYISGNCAIAVAGTRAGKPARLSSAQVLSGASPIKFKLRYFKNLAGTLRLPAHFKPKEVDISIASGTAPTTTSSYSWPLFKG
jgi:hypothetical protein